MKKKIVFFHALNDYSGSPNILSQVIRGLISEGYTAELYTSSKSGGFLSEIEGLKYHKVFYDFYSNRLLTASLFVFVQLRYFFLALRHAINRNTVFYINTILPFGAAIGASIFHREIIYHIHENPVNRNIVQKVAVAIFLRCCTKAIFVSKYTLESYSLDESKKFLVSNALPSLFTDMAKEGSLGYTTKGEIMMVCSLKIYKGIMVFKEIAELMPEHNFTLVLNGREKEIQSFIESCSFIRNLKISGPCSSLNSFYKKSNLVLNLSLPDLCVESFGLTALEAMVYGIPVIVPPVGGIADLVQDGVNGYKADARRLNTVIEKIKLVFSDRPNYEKMSKNAKEIANSHSNSEMIKEIDQIIHR